MTDKIIKEKQDWITELMVELTMSYELRCSLNDFREALQKHLKDKIILERKDIEEVIEKINMLHKINPDPKQQDLIKTVTNIVNMFITEELLSLPQSLQSNNSEDVK